MKLEVGENMYIRTKNGIIAKILNIKDGFAWCDNVLEKVPDEGYSFYESDYFIIDNEIDLDTIKKASYNIIDILECGDIIKLFMEDDIDGEDTNIFELIAINYNDNEIGVFNSDFQIEFFPIENLRGILTHEQMEQMAYKVGE